MGGYRYLPLSDDQALREAWARSGTISFGEDYDKVLEYLNRLDRARWCRVLLDEQDQLIGTLMSTRVGMFINASRVSAEAVGFVTIPPEHRGKRASVELMHHHLREARENGSAISVLYSARARLYRGVGYETAGRGGMIRIPLRTLSARSDDGINEIGVREMTEEDQPSVRKVYREFAELQNGYLDRDDWFWNFIRGRYAKHMRMGYMFERAGITSGYMIVHPGGPQGPKLGNETVIHDLAFTDAPTARAMIRFLSSFNSASNSAKMGGDIAHPLFDHADELWHTVETGALWLIRIVDFARAISERGFPEGMTGEVALGIEDPIFAENSGTWRVQVKDGRGSAVRVEEPVQATMGIDAFAPIFTGMKTPSQMHRNGRLLAEPAVLSRLDGLFAAPMPAMPDDF